MPDPSPYTSPVINLRPSKIDSLKSAVGGPSGTIIAIITALSGLVAVIQTYQESQQTARVSYDTLKAASEKNAAQIEICRKGQLDLQTWMEELTERFERRQVTTEKAITRKVTRAAAAPIAPLPIEPTLKPPVVPAVPELTPLPTFDKLKDE